MTHCSHCDTWLHAACAGVRGSAARRKLERLKGDTFMCPRCCATRGIAYTFASELPVEPELPLVRLSQASAPNLAVEPALTESVEVVHSIPQAAPVQVLVTD